MHSLCNLPSDDDDDEDDDDDGDDDDDDGDGDGGEVKDEDDGREKLVLSKQGVEVSAIFPNSSRRNMVQK